MNKQLKDDLMGVVEFALYFTIFFVAFLFLSGDSIEQRLTEIILFSFAGAFMAMLLIRIFREMPKRYRRNEA